MQSDRDMVASLAKKISKNLLLIFLFIGNF